MLISELFRFVPASTRDEVRTVYKRHGATIRHMVATSIRLPLHWQQRDGGPGWSCSCTVRVDEVGYPEVLACVEIADADALAARLQVWLAPLRRFVQASGAIARFTDELGDDLSGWIDRDRFAREAESAARMAAVLVGMADRPTLDLGKVIVEVDEDVLGAYAYDRQERSPYRGTHAAEIRLYWGAIGLLARVLDVTVEGLTVLVLAHEFAHAYTHLGFDRQGERWSGEAYAATDHVLKEALAQYWAWVALKKLEDRLPDGLAAYERVLPKQPPAYHAHGPWITRFRPDTIASALVRMRPKGAVHYEAFVEELERIEGPGGVALDLSEG